MAHELMNILVNHIHNRELRRCASLYLKERLIDIGCGEKPYCEMFRPFITEHVGVDHLNTLHDKSRVDLFGTAYSIPVEDGSFDCAVCTAVLEHLEEPEQALRECHRVLRVGGFAVYSVPFIWHLHEEPRDFYRFSKYGLQHLFQKCGFQHHRAKGSIRLLGNIRAAIGLQPLPAEPRAAAMVSDCGRTWATPARFGLCSGTAG